ncbi:septal ring lytic transglycosylase RlpA family protein [Thalassobaculum sp.]|uniref:septal ring lytic transglycosylase RlpA family protein n=1 Tax=Thalassobaculum sp. TaxID=2022740 RepID=UPI0032ECE8BB
MTGRPRVTVGVAMALIAALALGGCAETEFLANTAKQAKGTKSSSVGTYKVGNPYQIGGVWYYPKEDWEYVETGIASWYGPGFHGRSTANGETFDENDVTAAHRTLPLPSVVRVTNLTNGRALVVRVNDRGPFAHGRIIDLSRRSAQLLGFERQGTAKVRVEILPEDSRRDQIAARGGAVGPVLASATPDATPAPVPNAVPSPPVQVSRLEAPTGAAPSPAARNKALPSPATPPGGSGTSAVAAGGPPPGTVETVPVSDTDIWVQVGAFENRDNARRLSRQLKDIGPANVQEALVAGRTYYRVRVGPLTEVASADRTLEQLIAAGFPGSRIVVD